MKNIFFLLSIFVFVSCQQKQTNATDSEPSIEVLTADAFAEHIQNKEVQIIDVRTKKEFEEGHIKNAKHHHIYDKDFEEQIGYLDKEQPVYVYCKSGGRSKEAALELKKMGFKKIYDFRGGMFSWKGEVEK